MASAIGGVPASNRAGGAAYVVFSIVTVSIIEPPPRNGGIAASSSARPQSTPMPVGAEHLVPGERDEVDVVVDDVHRHMRYGLGRVQHQQRADLAYAAW